MLEKLNFILSQKQYFVNNRRRLNDKKSRKIHNFFNFFSGANINRAVAHLQQPAILFFMLFYLISMMLSSHIAGASYPMRFTMVAATLERPKEPLSAFTEYLSA